MPKVGMRPARERQLITATRAVLREEGFARTTMMRVAKQAGLSTGTVQHYFSDKEGLLSAVLAGLNRDLGAATLNHLRGAETPVDRLYAFVDGQFNPTQFTPETVAVWHVLWGNMREIPRLRYITSIYERRSQSNVRDTFKRLVPADQVGDQSDALLALIDGLWVRAAQSVNGLDAQSANRIARNYLTQQVIPFVTE